MTALRPRQTDGIRIDSGTPAAPKLLAEGWLTSWTRVGGQVTIGPDGQLVPWINFTSDPQLPQDAARLVGVVLETPGLPLAIRNLVEKVVS